MDVAAAIRRIEAIVAGWDGVRAGLIHLGCAPGEIDAVTQALETLGERVLVERVQESPEALRRLDELNRERELVLRQYAAVVFLTTSGEEARLLRRRATDLTAVLDGSWDVTAAPRQPWRQVLLPLREAMAQRHGTLDLSPYLPHVEEPVTPPIDALYLREAGIEGAGRPDFLTAPTLVFGAPGSGMTTALRFLAWQVATAAPDRLLPDDVEVALYVPLARWWVDAQDRVLPLRTFLERYAGEVLGRAPVDLGARLDGLVLLLDALDEVPDADARRRLLSEAAELRRAGAGVLLTSRDSVLDALEASDLAGWRRARMRVPPWEASLGLAQRLLDVLPRGDDAEPASAPPRPRALDLDLVLGGDVQRVELASAPFTLTLLVILFAMRRRLPSTPVHLWGEIAELWRVRLRETAGRHAPPGNRVDMDALLGRIATKTAGDRRGALHRREGLALLESDVRGSSAPADGGAADQLLDVLVQSGVLQAADGVCRLPHPSLAEYLAARWLLDLAPSELHGGRAHLLPFALPLSTNSRERTLLVRAAWARLFGREERDDWSTMFGAMLDAVDSGAERDALLRYGLSWLPGREAHRSWSSVAHRLLGASREPGLRAELIQQCARWLDDHRDRREWARLLCDALAVALDGSLIAIGTRWLEDHEDHPDWALALEALLDATRDEGVRAHLVSRGMGWLVGREEDRGWNFVIQALLDHATGEVERRELQALAASWLDGHTHHPGWSYLFTKVVEQTAEASLQRTFASLGPVWLRLHHDHPAWSHVFVRALKIADDPALREELLEEGVAWLDRNADDSGWSHVFRATLRKSDGARRRRLFDTGTSWLAGREEQSGWTYVLRELLAASRSAPLPLVQAGLEWLRAHPNHPGWPHVFCTLCSSAPAARAEQLEGLGRHWLKRHRKHSRMKAVARALRRLQARLHDGA